MSDFGRVYEEFEKGEKIFHPTTKIIDDKDNFTFCEITNNEHPLHTNEEYAKASIFGKIVVSGTHVFSLAVGLTVPEISGKAVANLGYSNVIHHKPTFIGDCLNVETIIMDKRESETNEKVGIISVKSKVYNQRSEKVMTFERTAMIPKRGY